MKTRLLTILVAVLALAAVTSCSPRSYNDIDTSLRLVASDSATVVAVCDVERLFGDGNLLADKSLTGLSLSMMFPEDLLLLKDLLTDKDNGLEADHIVVAANAGPGGMEAVTVFGVTDVDRLAKTLKDNGLDVKTTEVGGFKAIEAEGTALLVRDHTGFIAFNGNGAADMTASVAIVEGFVARAAATPAADWKMAYLTETNCLNALIKSDVVDRLFGLEPGTARAQLTSMGMGIAGDGYVALRSDIDADSWSMHVGCLDKDGRTVKVPGIGRFDRELMAYAYPTDFVAVSLAMDSTGYRALGRAITDMYESMADYGGIIDHETRHYRRVIQQLASIPSEYLTPGGVFVSAGPADGDKAAGFDGDPLKSFHIVAAARIRPEKAGEAYRALCDAVCKAADATGHESERDGMKVHTIPMKTAERYDYRTGEWVGETVEIQVALDGDILLVTTGGIRRAAASPFDANLFENSMLTVQLVLMKDNILTQLYGADSDMNAWLTVRADGIEVKITK